MDAIWIFTAKAQIKTPIFWISEAHHFLTRADYQ